MLLELNWLIGVNTVTGEAHTVGEWAAFDNALTPAQIKKLFEVTKHRYQIPAAKGKEGNEVES